MSRTGALLLQEQCCQKLCHAFIAARTAPTGTAPVHA